MAPCPVRCRGILALLALVAVATPAAAQDAAAAPDEAAPEEVSEEKHDDYVKAGAAPKVEWGVGTRLRLIFVPRGLVELFFEEVPSGVASPGFGLEVTRRKGDFEMSFGLEYENLSPEDGFYREKGGGDDAANVSAKTDYTEFDGFSWVTLDAAFVFHRPLTKQIALRYGAGFGLGILRGEIRQTDSICSSADIANDCTPNPNGAQVNDPADLPPVFPVVSLLAGAQFRPMEKLAINLELGLRTVFYTGLGATYFF